MKYAAIITDQIYHEGDERSRTHPGHGYPAYYEDVTKFKEFRDENELKKWLLSNKDKKNFKIVKYEDVKISYDVQISLN